MNCREFPWLKVLRVTGICCGLCIIALGLYSLITSSPSFESVVADVYRVIFGILIVIAELQFVKLLDWFSFLCTLIGLGGFYIFVGGLALGSEWYAITLAVIMCVIGLVYCMAGATCQDDRPTARDLKEGKPSGSASSGNVNASPDAPAKSSHEHAQPKPKKAAQWPNMEEDAL